MRQVKTFTLKKVLLVSLAFAGTLAVAVLWLYQTQSTHTIQASPSVDRWLRSTDEGFARVESGWIFNFPDDHSAHPAFPTESWYFNGNLSATNGQRFAFQVTFFRFALSSEPPKTDSAWTTNQIYRAHFAITDVNQKQFHASERYSRAALELAGAERSPARVWLENWEIIILDDGEVSKFQLRAGTKDLDLELTLTEIKPAVFGNEGLAKISAGNSRFHAYSLPRLTAHGRLQLNAKPLPVKGLAWLDHAWGEVPLPRGQIALNRFVLQLDDNREIMLFQLRRRDGSGTPINRGLMILANGSLRRLRQRDLVLEVLDHWKSPRDSSHYPARWRLQIPAEGMDLEIVPLLPDQELDLTRRYWAGGVGIDGQRTGKRLSGHGHVELTGYSFNSL